MKTNGFRSMAICLAVILVSVCNIVNAQVDTSQFVKPDTAIVQPVTPAPDTAALQTLTTPPDTTIQPQKKEKVDRKRKDEFIPYVGVNFNQVTSSDEYESSAGIGYHLGFNYKRGKFFYWQVGARFNNAVFDLTNNADSTDGVSIKDIDLQVTGGINFLSPLNRIVALRIFVSAVPSFALGVGDNDLGIVKDDINSFMLYGQAGLGINVAFLVIEAGYNYGFQDMLKDYDSKPGQVFVNLGFRF